MVPLKGYGRGKGFQGPKGKGSSKGTFSKGKGHRTPPQGTSLATLVCGFCHIQGHHESNCRKRNVLHNSDAYQQARSQQSAYLEALDQYIDYDEYGNLRKCLLDENGNRLIDKDGNVKTLRHKFAVYCDDIAAGAGTLEELYELFEALLCCCAKAGIQVCGNSSLQYIVLIRYNSYRYQLDAQ